MQFDIHLPLWKESQKHSEEIISDKYKSIIEYK